MTTELATAPAARFVNTICFHGLNVAVFQAEGVDYIPARPLCELAGLDWKGAKRTLQSPDKVYLYGFKRLIPPYIAGLGGLKSPQEGVLCLRLERSRMYLAQYQHQSRALTWWQQCGLEEISEPGITERRRQPQSKPTMIQELELIQALSEHGKSRNHAHCCGCHRQIGQHSHG